MVDQASRIRWNTFFTFLSQAIRLLTNFILFICIARFYGPVAFGQFTTAHTLSALFLIFADFGFDMLITTEVARNREHATEIAQKYFSLKMLFAIVATITLMLFPLFQNMSPSAVLLIEIFGFNVFFSSLSNLFFALFKGYEQLHHETRISFIINSISLCFLYIAWDYHLPLYAFAIIFVSTRMIGFIIAFRVASKIIKVNIVRLNYSDWLVTIKQVLIFGLLIVFGNLCFQVDTILLASLKGASDVGIYQAVFKITVLILVIPDIATNTLMPVLSRLNRENGYQWNILGQLLNKTLTFISLIISAVTFIYADQIISLIYGSNQFTESGFLLRIFSLIIFIRFAAETYGLMLTTALRQKERMFVVLSATILNVILNLYAIPRYGTMGAAIVSLITNIFIYAGYVFEVRKVFSGWQINSKIIVSFILYVLVVIISWSLRKWSILYVAPVLIIISTLMFYLLGYTKGERSLIFTFKSQVHNN